MRSKEEIAHWLNKCASFTPECDKCPWHDDITGNPACFDQLMLDAAAVMIADIEARVQEVIGDEKQG